MITETSGFHLSEQELHTPIGGWPGDSVAFGCGFNRGRSVFARACFKVAFPEVSDVTSFAVNELAESVSNRKFMDLDVYTILHEQDYPTDDNQTLFDEVRIKKDTDYILLVEDVGDWSMSNGPYRSFLYNIVNNSRTVTCLPIKDRTVFGDNPERVVNNSSRKSAIFQTFTEIQILVFTQLKRVMLDVRDKKYARVNGIYYPFGEPVNEMSTFKYLKRNFGWTGDIS